MNLVSLLMLPAVISMRDSNARFIVAGAALLVLGTAIWWSKRVPAGIPEGAPAK
jgi:hypothetical protein